MVMSTLRASDTMMERIARETSMDEVLQSVIKCVLEGWCKGQNAAYANFKEELSVINGVLMKGARIVIPQKLRGDMLELIHVGHLGAEKQKRLARDLLYWPNMNRDIDMNVQTCGVCLKYRKAQSKEPLLETECRKWGPWDRVGMDLMTWERKEYLVIVDYFSNYPELALLTSTSSESVINQVKSVFARHGIPRVVVSDNGPQFSSSKFRDFAKTYGFKHETSSPYYPRANGQAEKGVGIIKQLLNRAKERQEDPYLAMLAYRKAPRELGASPAELLMNRNLRSQLLEVDKCHVKEIGRAHV